MKHCETCEYFRKYTGHEGGECFLDPPEVFMLNTGTVLHVRPMVMESDWCSNHSDNEYRSDEAPPWAN